MSGQSALPGKSPLPGAVASVVRTGLVGRTHVDAWNPDGRLRLGAPVTVTIQPKDEPAARGEKPCG